MSKTTVILKWAQTNDGFLDHNDNKPLRISSPEDKASVAKLRSQCELILVGASTVRRDDPVLKLSKSFSAKNPPLDRAALTSSAEMDSSARIFDNDGARRIIFATEKIDNVSRFTKNGVEIITINPENPAKDVLNWCIDQNINTVLVEGGSRVHRTFFESNVVDLVRIATGNFTAGTNGTTRSINFADFEGSFSKMHSASLGGTEVVWWRNQSFSETEAIQLTDLQS